MTTIDIDEAAFNNFPVNAAILRCMEILREPSKGELHVAVRAMDLALVVGFAYGAMQEHAANKGREGRLIAANLDARVRVLEAQKDRTP